MIRTSLTKIMELDSSLLVFSYKTTLPNQKKDNEPTPDQHELKTKIYEILKKDIGLCTAKYGYIINIYTNIDINDIVISNATSRNLIIVKYEADLLKPEIGKKYSGICVSIQQGGILCIHDNILKIFIPEKNLTEYKYILNSFKNNTDQIQLGSIITIVIDSTQYHKKVFKCIGHINNSIHPK